MNYQLTYEEAIKFFRYDKETGKLYWKINRGGRKINDEVGTIGSTKTNKYRITKINYVNYKIHRIIWLMTYGKFPNNCIDHIDGNSLNNKLENLREATYLTNNKNHPIRITNKSGHNRITIVENKHLGTRYRVTGRNNKDRECSLGTFDTLEKAIQVRKEYEIKNNYSFEHGKRIKNEEIK